MRESHWSVLPERDPQRQVIVAAEERRMSEIRQSFPYHPAVAGRAPDHAVGAHQLKAGEV